MKCTIEIEMDNATFETEPASELISILRRRFAQEDLEQYGTPLKYNPWMRPLVGGTLPDGSVAHVFRGGVK